ncbi:XisI protein [Leptothoe spongobia]|uniref:XisI protein n=1 Tax=Leptothoe spongobia TAU-MAC 1115 TaxID=1967444 RepID=A0A947GIQ2_9CYAN|nr:XisI protein [Leptothoe spongobia]MBT9315042.1 XisI protein [Leptothoe spongobia TAU-MAC 1115]
MDKLKNYRYIIQKVLTEYQQWAAGENQPGIEQCLSLDETRDQYLWFHVGWQEKMRDFGVTVYLRIEQDKVWIEEDWTKQGIANELLEAGIPAEDIVLGFQHPSKRVLTEFAVA